MGSADVVLPVLRFNFANPNGEPATQREMILAAIEMATWGDTRGVAAVSVDEHHLTSHAWSSNPVMAAALFLQNTTNMIVSIDCALGPLWNPLRLAEDIRFVDSMSAGRLLTTVGLGYRSVEYQGFGVDFHRRAALMDRLLEKMLAAWSADAFVDDRQGSRIGAGTWSQPHPPLYVGGGVRATARRAVRFNLGLSLPAHLPELGQYYLDLCQREGLEPNLIMPTAINRGMIFLHEEPEKAWAELGEHILWEAVTYGGWVDGAPLSSMHLPGVLTLDEVRASGRYRFLTPDELVAEARDCPDYGPMVFHPLVGGMPIDEAWKSVQLFTDVVIPQLR
ncbi:LLM class flavin-dependent oxidoreductase [Mycobacterium sp. NPDC050041]|uniref:LLM class flavin-dependent oxidoreductase n=1 Tax=Mycobacterium sp. NPDC050041 TaxID=3364293 RepID=UPI003C3080CF